MPPLLSSPVTFRMTTAFFGSIDIASLHPPFAPAEGGNNRASIYLAAQNIAINILKLESEGLRILANGHGRQLRGLQIHNERKGIDPAATQMRGVTDRKIRWIIREKTKGILSTNDIALLQNVNRSRISQIWCHYKNAILYVIRCLTNLYIML